MKRKINKKQTFYQKNKMKFSQFFSLTNSKVKDLIIQFKVIFKEFYKNVLKHIDAPVLEKLEQKGK